MYYRQVVIISERAQERDTSEADSRDTNLSNLKYHSQEEAKLSVRVQQPMPLLMFNGGQFVIHEPDKTSETGFSCHGFGAEW